MKLACIALVVLALVLPAFATHDLAETYTFRQVLYNENDEFYELFWSFDSAARNISFAVNVSTTGWVGFGISPNGGMAGSDVVIGWVESDGSPRFDDRFADANALPRIDEVQNWDLLRAEEENGYTVLEFRRFLVTCDPNNDDLDIEFDTSRVIWSLNNVDPLPGGNPLQHNFRGTRSINLLGRQENGSPPDPDDVEFFDLAVNNVVIPSGDTTYWCQAFELPANVQNQERYITRVSPVLTDHVREYVHHMLVYLCDPPLDASELNESQPCHLVTQNVGRCQQGLLVAGWAVGGEDFVYPENVAYPVGGPNGRNTAIIQMHYDNPDLDAGVVDNSGVRFYYTSTERENRAGILFVGHAVTRFMVVPPRIANYTVAGVCDSQCTQGLENLPGQQITIFANLLHTHVVGHGLTLQHFRYNTECNVWEELAPIDQNLRYDFNFQQYTYLPQEVAIRPGDLIVLECFYDTESNSDVTFGGESTREEMCLTFPVYYPQIPDLDSCVSVPALLPQSNINAFEPFLQNLTDSRQVNDDVIDRIRSGLEASDPDVFNDPGIQWNAQQAEALENSVLNGPYGAFCGGTPILVNGLPDLSQCPYQRPDVCNPNSEQLTCCERVSLGAPALFSFLSSTLLVLGVIVAVL